jgi:uncharacterized membrane protein YdbT with pleckstrin-like domain
MAPQSDLIARHRVSYKGFAGLYLLLAVVSALIWWLGYAYATLIGGAIIFLAGLLPIVAGLLYTWLVRISTEHRIFHDSLEVESGIVSRRIENIQLFRVRDIGLKQSILGRILDFGDIHIASTDQSNPHFTLRGLDHPRALYQLLRELVAKSQAARRTMILEEEVPNLSSEG